VAEIRARLRSLGELAARHEGLTFALAYLVVAAIGFFHLTWFFWILRVPILEFADLSDFLLAPLRDPFVVLMSLLPLPLIYGFMRLDAWMYRTIPSMKAKAADPEHVRKRDAMARVSYPLALVIWIVVFNMYYGNWKAWRVIEGHSKQVEAAWVNGESIAALPDTTVALLPSTTRHMFFYRPRTRETVIVPHDQVKAVVVAKPKRVRKGPAWLVRWLGRE